MDFKRKELNLEATELRLGPPGETEKSSPLIRSNKRALLPDMNESAKSDAAADGKPPESGAPPPTKAQVVGWPPIRSYRKNSLQVQASKSSGGEAGTYVKVSMDGAPYLRKIDLQLYKGYQELLKALQDMFKFRMGEYCEKEGYSGSEFVPTYDDKDGDNMLVGDVPWDMFITSCKRLRIMKRSEAAGGLGLLHICP